VGRERLVSLRLTGPGIEFARFQVMTRNPPAPVPGGHLGVYAATFKHLAAPGRTATGTVKDKKTGKPLAGIVVVDQSGHNRAVTDEKGRYFLPGLPRVSAHRLYAAGGKDLPYFDAVRSIDAKLGDETARADFELERGLMMTGRLTEKGTGRPLKGRVFYAPLPGNPNRAEPSTTASAGSA
jgi:hypothetical protein